MTRPLDGTVQKPRPSLVNSSHETLACPSDPFHLGCAASSEVDSMMPASFTGSDGTLPMDAQAIVFDVEVEDEGAPDAFQSDAEVFECDPLTQCGQHCVETQTDPSNCGGCGEHASFQMPKPTVSTGNVN